MLLFLHRAVCLGYPPDSSTMIFEDTILLLFVRLPAGCVGRGTVALRRCLQL